MWMAQAMREKWCGRSCIGTHNSTSQHACVCLSPQEGLALKALHVRPGKIWDIPRDIPFGMVWD